MQYLKKTVIVVLLLLSLAFIKSQTLKGTAASSFFISNLLADLQLLLFLWLIAVGLFQLIAGKIFHKKLSAFRATGIFLVLLSLSELTMSFLLRNPEKIPGFLYSSFTHYYFRYSCNIIQYNPACSEYDSLLTYRLVRDKQFSLNNFEFDTRYSTNCLGLRDDNASLQSPDIICLGDSYTLGWGVNQDETFAEILQKNTRYKVLNAGISSYGTAREVLSLKKFDLSHLKFIIIQLSANDKLENEVYLKNMNSLPIKSPKEYAFLQRSHVITTTYYPWRHTLTIGRLFLHTAVLKNIKDEETTTDEADYENDKLAIDEFIEVLKTMPVDTSQVKIIVFDIPWNTEFKTSKLSAVMNKQVEAAKNTAGFGLSLYHVDPSASLQYEDYYPLDGHLKPIGHKKIADAIVRKLDEIK